MATGYNLTKKDNNVNQTDLSADSLLGLKKGGADIWWYTNN